jgi:phosphatidylserine/phosphatidylglycerophosphate/cardiolipin synthase-like enzyme
MTMTRTWRVVMFKRLFSNSFDTNALCTSRLFDNETFYKAFLGDLRRANQNVYIESPFITTKRMSMLLTILKQARQRGIQITVNTRPPNEHAGKYISQAYESVQDMQSIGITVLYTVKQHRKIAIIDDEILREGSLNILSQSDSCELMRRSVSSSLVRQMKKYIKCTN